MGGGWFNRELKILVLFLTLISFSNLIFGNNTFALFMPTLSASVDQANLQVNGNQVINSTDKTTEIPLNLTVNTNNKTGYTATLNSETDETALVNNDSTTNAKINSISSAGPLGDFSNNTWGYKFGASTSYAPIPALSTPAQILQTAGKTNGNESNQLSIGMKLSDNLESGRYTNKLVFSIITNNYNRIAIMTEGPDFNTKLKSLGAFEHFKKSSTPPATTANAKNIEDEDSDYEIKLWLDPTDKTAYYYAEPEKVYLNTDSSKMFYDMRNFTILNLPNFDTSKVTNMQYMFSDMTKLTTLDLSNFDTSKVTDMKYMFNEMYSLTSLNLSSFNTSNVTDMSCMFAHMFRLTSLNLSNFNTSNVTNMGWVFAFNGSEKIYVNNDFNTSKLTNFSNMFKESKKLRGGNGSYLADPSTADKTWLRVDRPGVHGYFTRKP
ncbi:MAG: BspA family leucine-rich repeat surface protein [Candidatus Nanosynbacter sp.]|nr:BspA family leucine-rich repeat surface protein [Candidatus Nanosynbacter sp.]